MTFSGPWASVAVEKTGCRRSAHRLIDQGENTGAAARFWCHAEDHRRDFASRCQSYLRQPSPGLLTPDRDIDAQELPDSGLEPVAYQRARIPFVGGDHRSDDMAASEPA